VCAEAEPSGLPVHMRSRTLAHHGVLLRLAPAEVCRNQREDNAVGAPSLAEGSQASTSFSTAMNRSRLSRESMKSDEAAFKTASPPIPAASHSVARAGMRSGGMGSNRSGCQPLERPDWAPKVSLGWARVRGGRDGAARLPATDPRGHRTNLDMSRLRGLVGVQGGRCDRGRAFLLGPSTRPD
jgi:hypothetical protein